MQKNVRFFFYKISLGELQFRYFLFSPLCNLICIFQMGWSPWDLLLLMEEIRQTHQLSLVVEIPLFTVSFTHFRWLALGFLVAINSSNYQRFHFILKARFLRGESQPSILEVFPEVGNTMMALEGLGGPWAEKGMTWKFVLEREWWYSEQRFRYKKHPKIVLAWIHLVAAGFKDVIVFTAIWGRFPLWLIFFSWVETLR